MITPGWPPTRGRPRCGPDGPEGWPSRSRSSSRSPCTSLRRMARSRWQSSPGGRRGGCDAARPAEGRPGDQPRGSGRLHRQCDPCRPAPCPAPCPGAGQRRAADAPLASDRRRCRLGGVDAGGLRGEPGAVRRDPHSRGVRVRGLYRRAVFLLALASAALTRRRTSSRARKWLPRQSPSSPEALLPTRRARA
jgi:hypothetical protein